MQGDMIRTTSQYACQSVAKLQNCCDLEVARGQQAASRKLIEWVLPMSNTRSNMASVGIIWLNPPLAGEGGGRITLP